MDPLTVSILVVKETEDLIKMTVVGPMCKETGRYHHSFSLFSREFRIGSTAIQHETNGLAGICLLDVTGS